MRFKRFKLLASLNYTLRTPSQNWIPTAHSRTQRDARRRCAIISVAVQISLAQEIAEALGLSVAADPRE